MPGPAVPATHHRDPRGAEPPPPADCRLGSGSGPRSAPSRLPSRRGRCRRRGRPRRRGSAASRDAPSVDPALPRCPLARLSDGRGRSAPPSRQAAGRCPASPRTGPPPRRRGRSARRTPSLQGGRGIGSSECRPGSSRPSSAGRSRRRQGCRKAGSPDVSSRAGDATSAWRWTARPPSRSSGRPAAPTVRQSPAVRRARRPRGSSARADDPDTAQRGPHRQGWRRCRRPPCLATGPADAPPRRSGRRRSLASSAPAPRRRRSGGRPGPRRGRAPTGRPSRGSRPGSPPSGGDTRRAQCLPSDPTAGAHGCHRRSRSGVARSRSRR